MSDTKTNTRIQIAYSDEKTARSIQKAIIPDNIGVPYGMHIIILVDGNNLEIEVFSKKSIGSLVATLDDLLSCVQAAEKTLDGV